MTAAGTVPPAQVVVLGAGVAGLQAIATCRRLGAVVKGYDVRAAAAEEIRSMGAQAIELDLPTLEGAGGYAREMTEERAERQRELLAPYIAAADALITTAAVPGRQAPVLVTAEMVTADEAGLGGGRPGGGVGRQRRGRRSPATCRNVGGVQLWGGANVPSQMPGPASRLYAQNVINVILLMTREAEFDPDFDDEIVAAMCVTHPGLRRRRRRRHRMSEAIIWLTIFVLAAFVGVEVISKVSSTLHTPLMSGANAIHGVILIGAILVAGHRRVDPDAGARPGRRGAGRDQHGRRVRGHRPDAADVPAQAARAAADRGARAVTTPVWAQLGYLVAAVCFILALKGLSSPRTARRGNLIGAAGAVLATVIVFAAAPLDHLVPILVALAIGTAIGAVGAYRVQMTQMPQLVALFNGVGGGAAAIVALIELDQILFRLTARDIPDAGRA